MGEQTPESAKQPLGFPSSVSSGKDQSGTSNQTTGDKFQDYLLEERVTLLGHKKIVFCVVVGVVVVFYAALLMYIFCPQINASPIHAAERVATIIALSAIPTALLVVVLKSLYKSDFTNDKKEQEKDDTIIPPSPIFTLIIELANYLKDK
ncbi:hypothetical protein [Acidithiobacillus thiooxidans]|uniref:hypothetical protein n=1 Tax=Acidithiobacillus thiooxidans TaxID=930 RepID=UPI0009DAD87D|nr:hypothetical protein [Acidithiobacillus thiooxidans]